MPVPGRLSDFGRRWATRDNPLDFSGVWRFRELLDFCNDKFKTTLGEGQTPTQRCDGVGEYVGSWKGNLFLHYEGCNPSGSFKDNGMAAAFSHARLTGAKRVACASTGNTSAALALYVLRRVDWERPIVPHARETAPDDPSGPVQPEDGPES